MLNPLELTGRASTHVMALPELGCTVHAGVVEPLRALHEAARADGVELKVVSSFRPFDRQVEIWNAKFLGSRPLHGRDGRLLDRAQLDPNALIDAILAWSALPGASRHHWGTDVDIAGGAAMAAGYQAQLLPEEFAPGGVFVALNAWLEANLPRFGFFRPYRTDRGGVQPEAWHASFAPVASVAIDALSLEVLIEAIAASSMFGRDVVLARIPELYERYVRGFDPPPQTSLMVSDGLRPSKTV